MLVVLIVFLLSCGSLYPFLMLLRLGLLSVIVTFAGHHCLCFLDVYSISP